MQAGPVSVLRGEGVFSCLCLALHQAHVVIAGTAEGCLLLWDLRGPTSTHLAAVRYRLAGYLAGQLELAVASIDRGLN